MGGQDIAKSVNILSEAVVIILMSSSNVFRLFQDNANSTNSSIPGDDELWKTRMREVRI